MTPLLAMVWALLFLAALTARRPAPPRLRRLLAPPRAGRPAERTKRHLHEWVGMAVLDVLSALDPRRRAHPAQWERQARRIGSAVLASLPLLAVRPALAPVAAALGSCYPLLEDRSAARAHRLGVERQLPDIVDLLALAISTGLNVPMALAGVQRRAPPGPVTDALRNALDATAAGSRLADALDEAARALGDPARPLVGALVASERYGVPLSQSLDRLALEVRANRRRRAEEAARRVPVKLLFPLVTCSLPAFALLTVAPLFASGLSSLRLPN